MELIKKIITIHKARVSPPRSPCGHLGGGESQIFEKTISLKNRQGLPIGNLTSQLFANIYLNELDHFVKEKLKERWYGRYMDDFFVISADKNHLKIIKDKIQEFLAKNLKLSLHPGKTLIQNVKNGVCFVGYRVFWDHILVRGSTLLRIQKKLKKRKNSLKKGKISQEKFQQTINSFKGHLKYANAWRLGEFLFC